MAGQTSTPKRPLGLKIGIVDGILALGHSFRDADGRQLYGSGRALGRIHTIHRTSLPELADTELIVASDVHNPLLGPNGASARDVWVNARIRCS
ncbi:glycerate kinase [Pseudarthrobacter sp. Y6]|uniref:glycerate kinase n=1 Tax=Pseudarthrobacter sp. Y6 TaxID=3418422 RepID=UPI003CEE0AC2